MSKPNHTTDTNAASRLRILEESQAGCKLGNDSDSRVLTATTDPEEILERISWTRGWTGGDASVDSPNSVA